MQTKRCVLITFKDESFVERLEILLCFLAVGAVLKGHQLSKKILFKFGFVIFNMFCNSLHVFFS